MKLSTLLPLLCGSAVIKASNVGLIPRQAGVEKDMQEFEDWAVINAWCPIYIGHPQPPYDRSGKICQRYCDEKRNGERGYSSCESQRLVDATDKFPSELVPGEAGAVSYQTDLDGYPYIPTTCSCSNPGVEAFTREMFEIVVRTLEALENIVCAVFLTAIMTIVEEGISFIPVAGPVFKSYQTAVKAAKTFAENAGGATDMFTGWIGPVCDMPPALDQNDAFDKLVTSPDDIGRSTGCQQKKKSQCRDLPEPDNDTRPTGRAQDDRAAPTTAPPPTTQANSGSQPTRTTATSSDESSAAACNIRRATPELYHVYRDPLEKPGQKGYFRGVRYTECAGGTTTTLEYEVTSVVYDSAPTTVPVTKTCSDNAAQACHHYQSAIDQNPEWKTLACPGSEYNKGEKRVGKSPAVADFDRGVSRAWQNEQWRPFKDHKPGTRACQADEFPPHYLLDKQDPIWTNGGTSLKSQLIRYMPNGDNSNGGALWKGLCFYEAIDQYDGPKLWDRVRNHAISQSAPKRSGSGKQITMRREVKIRTQYKPALVIDFQQSNQDPPGATQKDYGLSLNDCLPKFSMDHTGTQNFDDPGFALLRIDKYNVDRNAEIDRYNKTGSAPQAQAGQPAPAPVPAVPALPAMPVAPLPVALPRDIHHIRQRSQPVEVF